MYNSRPTAKGSTVYQAAPGYSGRLVHSTIPSKDVHEKVSKLSSASPHSVRTSAVILDHCDETEALEKLKWSYHVGSLDLSGLLDPEFLETYLREVKGGELSVMSIVGSAHDDGVSFSPTTRVLSLRLTKDTYETFGLVGKKLGRGKYEQSQWLVEIPLTHEAVWRCNSMEVGGAGKRKRKKKENSDGPRVKHMKKGAFLNFLAKARVAVARLPRFWCAISWVPGDIAKALRKEGKAPDAEEWERWGQSSTSGEDLIFPEGTLLHPEKRTISATVRDAALRPFSSLGARSGTHEYFSGMDTPKEAQISSQTPERAAVGLWEYIGGVVGECGDGHGLPEISQSWEQCLGSLGILRPETEATYGDMQLGFDALNERHETRRAAHGDRTVDGKLEASYADGLGLRKLPESILGSSESLDLFADLAAMYEPACEFAGSPLPDLPYLSPYAGVGCGELDPRVPPHSNSGSRKRRGGDGLHGKMGSLSQLGFPLPSLPPCARVFTWSGPLPSVMMVAITSTLRAARELRSSGAPGVVGCEESSCFSGCLVVVGSDTVPSGHPYIPHLGSPAAHWGTIIHHTGDAELYDAHDW